MNIINNTNLLEFKAENNSELRRIILTGNAKKKSVEFSDNKYIQLININTNHLNQCHKVKVDAIAQKNSTLEIHFLNQLDNDGSVIFDIDLTVEDNCNVTLSVASISGQQIDTKINVNIIGQHSTINLPGIMLPFANENFTYHSTVTHNIGNSTTQQPIRIVANQNGFGDFYGIIKVVANAQKSITEQVNNNILLSPDAHIESKPQLEIYADDVKCSHGSTTGMLNQDAIFYMQSRGISKKTAQNLLLEAFINEVVETFTTVQEYKDLLRKNFSEKLTLRGC